MNRKGYWGELTWKGWLLNFCFMSLIILGLVYFFLHIEVFTCTVESDYCWHFRQKCIENNESLNYSYKCSLCRKMTGFQEFGGSTEVTICNDPFRKYPYTPKWVRE